MKTFECTLMLKGPCGTTTTRPSPIIAECLQDALMKLHEGWPSFVRPVEVTGVVLKEVEP